MPAQDLASLFRMEPSAKMADIAQLGPAPRDIDARLDQYVRKATRSLASLWIFLAVLLWVGEVFSWVIGIHALPIAPLLFTALAVWSGRKRARAREALRDTLKHGQLMRAEITNMRCVEYRGRYGQVRYVDYFVTFTSPNGPVVLKTRDPGVSLLQIGLSEEIVWSEKQPDVVVPTMLLC